MSYSRADSDFVRRLADDLAQRGKDVWVDVDGIRDAERFPEALRAAIQQADAFVFVISPDSVASEFCELEVRHASELNKRIVPVALHQVPDEAIPDEVRYRNWIPAQPGGGPPVDRVITAIETDLAWEKQHTDMTVRALRWDSAKRDGSMLLRGSELAAAERWLTEGASKDPGPTALEQEYVFAARRATSRRQRTLVGASATVTVIAVALLVFALISRGQAVDAESTAKSQALAADSQTQLATDPELSVLLGIHAVEQKPTPQALLALRQALDASPIRARAPIAPAGACLVPGQDPSLSVGANAAISFSPDGTEIAEGLCINKEIRIVNAATGRISRTVRLDGPGLISAWATPRQIVVEPAGRLEVVDPVTGRVARVGPRVLGQSQPAVDPRAPVVAVAEYNDVVIWDLRNGGLRRLPIAHTPASLPIRLAFSPDGQRLALATLSFGAPAVPGVRILSVASGRLLAATPVHVNGGNPPLSADGVAYSPDGRLLYVADGNPATFNGRIDAFDSQTLRPVSALRRVANNFGLTVAASADGTRVAEGFADGSAGILSTTGQPIVDFPRATGKVATVAFSPNGKLVAENTLDGQLLIMQATPLASTTISVPPGPAPPTVSEVAPDSIGAITVQGNRIVAGQWTGSGAPMAPPLVVSPNAQLIAAAAASPDGRYVAVQDANPRAPLMPTSLRIWDLRERAINRTLPPTVAPNPMTEAFASPLFLPGDRTIAITAAAPHGAYRDELIDTATGRVRVLQTSSCAPPLTPNAVATVPSGRLVAFLHTCGPVGVFNVHTGAAVGKPIVLPAGVNNANQTIVLSPNGSELAVGGSSGKITIISLSSRRPITTLNQNLEAVYALAFSPDGHYLASGGHDGTVRIWDAHTWNEIRAIDDRAIVYQVTFSANSQTIAASDFSGAIHEWSTCPDCENPGALLALARTRVTRPLSPEERHEFSVN